MSPLFFPVSSWQQQNQDPFANNIILLLKGNGTSGSTNIIDSSPNPKTISVFGNTQISTAQSKYGGSSIVFDGVGDYLEISPLTAFNFGTGDFTIESWIRLNLNDTEYRNVIRLDYGSVGISLRFGNSGFGNQFQFNANDLDLAGCHLTTFTRPGIWVNTWNHVAFVRQSQINRYFINGVLAPTTILGNNTPQNTRSNSTNYTGLISLRIGTEWSGFQAPLRITTAARYNANFNPETDTYLNI